MTVGSIQTLVVCVPSQFAQSPCPTGMAISTIQGYVIDSSQAQNFEAQNAPFDYVTASSLWSLSFCFVIGLFFASKKIGILLSFIRGY